MTPLSDALTAAQRSALAAPLVTVSTRCLMCDGSGELPRSWGTPCASCEGWGQVLQVPAALAGSHLALAAAQLRGTRAPESQRDGTGA